jgi:hypothetical protein
LVEQMTISRTDVLTNIAARIRELNDLADLIPDPGLNADIYRISGLLRAVLVLISDLPNSFDETSPWWAEWAAKQKLLGGEADPINSEP